MKHRIFRGARRLAVEVLLAAGASLVVGRMVSMGRYDLAGGALLVGLLACGVGTLAAWRSGELAMAWRCPRLDALQLAPGSRDAPWEALVASDAALATLQGAGRYQEFFPEARRHLVQSAFRALAAHRLAARAREALVDAPAGEARTRLESQLAMATQELLAIESALRDLRARLVASTAPILEGEAPGALAQIGEQSDLLAQSIDALHRAPEALPAIRGS